MVRSFEQDELYKKYRNLGESVVKQFLIQDEILNQKMWQLITKMGFWELAVADQNDDIILNWKNFIIAFEGLISNYHNKELFSSLITQVVAIYFVSKHEVESNKRIYLPRLLKGNIINDDGFLNLQNKNIAVYQDLINTKRLLYGLAAVKFSLSILDKKSHDFILKKGSDDVYNKAKRSLAISQHRIYSLFEIN